MNETTRDLINLTIAEIFIIIIAIIVVISMSPNPEPIKEIINVSTCKYIYDNQTGQTYSEGCREECGCYVLEEYNVVVDVNDIGNVLGDIINNITNKTETET
jgi:hypothetical protein